MYVDVHTHLTHARFENDYEAVIANAKKVGVEAIIVNGLEPKSNRQTLDLAKRFDNIYPALGIYPIEAIHPMVKDLDLTKSDFDVDQEIAFIEENARQDKIIAIGECGLDGYWVGQETFAEQERVFIELIEIGKRYDKPIIIHTRKLEKRAMEILAHHDAKRVNFHCYCGKVKWAIDAAENYNWYFSIPANARNNEAFGKMLQKLPAENILTETDAPYLAPVRGERNEPANVVGTVAYLAELRGISTDQAKTLVSDNFRRLFKF